MPEIGDVRYFVYLFNQLQNVPIESWSNCPFHAKGKWISHVEPYGKTFRIHVASEEGPVDSVLCHLGYLGCLSFRRQPVKNPHARWSIHFSNGWYVTLVESTMVSWVRWTRFFQPGIDHKEKTPRGEDPIEQPKVLEKYWVRALNSSKIPAILKKPLSYALVNQEYFNGIGKYMTSAIVREMGDLNTQTVLASADLREQLLSTIKYIANSRYEYLMKKLGDALESLPEDFPITYHDFSCKARGWTFKKKT